MKRRDYTVICPLSEAFEMKKQIPLMKWRDIDTVAKSRKFIRWYLRNKKVVNTLAVLTPAFTLTLFDLSPAMSHTLLTHSSDAIPVMASEVHTPPPSFFSGHGVILLHMLLLGFITLVVTTFLKFTGRGDLAPLVVFVGGGVILYEVIGLFKDIYQEVATFLNM